MHEWLYLVTTLKLFCNTNAWWRPCLPSCDLNRTSLFTSRFAAIPWLLFLPCHGWILDPVSLHSASPHNPSLVSAALSSYQALEGRDRKWRCSAVQRPFVIRGKREQSLHAFNVFVWFRPTVLNVGSRGSPAKQESLNCSIIPPISNIMKNVWLFWSNTL